MKWSLLELNKYKDDKLEINEKLNVESSLLIRDKGILAVDPVNVTGTMSVSSSEYVLTVTMETIITLPSTRSLTPVRLPLTIDVTEIYMTPSQFESLKDTMADKDLVMVLEAETIDLAEAVEDHILLSIPLQVLTEEEKLSHTSIKGNDWEVLSEDAYWERKMQRDENKIDPRLAKLSALLDNSEESDEM